MRDGVFFMHKLSVASLNLRRFVSPCICVSVRSVLYVEPQLVPMGPELVTRQLPDLILAHRLDDIPSHYILSDLVCQHLISHRDKKLKCRCCWNSEKQATLSSTSSLISPRRPARTFSNCRYPLRHTLSAPDQ